MLKRSASTRVLGALVALYGLLLLARSWHEHRAPPSGRSAGLVEAASSPPPTNPVGALRKVWQFSLSSKRNTPASRATSLSGGVACGDFDGDGTYEIVARSDTGGVVLDANGRVKWKLPLGEEMINLAALRTPGGDRIMGFGTWSSAVEVRDGHGKRLWSYASPSRDDAVDFAAPIDLGDRRGQGVVIGYNGDGRVRVVNPDGALRWHASENMGNVWKVAGARLTRSGPDSAICTQDSIWVLDAGGHKTAEIGKDSDAGAVYAADLDGDGIDEVMGVGTTVSSGGYLSVYSANGHLRWRRQVRNPYAHLDSPILAGRFWPIGRQVTVGFGDGSVSLFDAGGKPVSFLKTGDALTAFAALPRAAGKTDALVARTSDGVACFAWKSGRASPIPARVLAPPPSEPEPAIISAIINHDVSGLERHLAAGANPNTTNRQGTPALTLAVNRGFQDMARTLIIKGANVNSRSKSDMTPLLEAASRGNIPMITLLLDSGADVQATRTYRISSGMDALILAAFDGRTDVARLLLDHGADPNHHSAMGDTALHEAATLGKVDLATLLLDRGAKVDSKGFLAATPLADAVMHQHKEMVELLLARGADPNARTDETLRNLFGAQFVGDEKAEKQIRQSLDKPHKMGPSIIEQARAIRASAEILAMLEQAARRKQ